LEFEDWAAFDFRCSLDLRSLTPHILAIEEYSAAALNRERFVPGTAALSRAVLELKSVDAFIKMKLNRLRDPDLAASPWRRRIGIRLRRLN
jgi:hypothetical protein